MSIILAKVNTNEKIKVLLKRSKFVLLRFCEPISLPQPALNECMCLVVDVNRLHEMLNHTLQLREQADP
jgi:hypothetical protein